MATIRKRIEVAAGPEKVWEKLSKVGEISKLIGFVSDSVLTGDTRVCSLAQGGSLKEKIVTVDAEARRVVYTITESPLNMAFHAASMEIEAAGDGTAMTWTVDLLPAEAAEQMEPMLAAAMEDMKSSLAA